MNQSSNRRSVSGPAGGAADHTRPSASRPTASPPGAGRRPDRIADQPPERPHDRASDRSPDRPSERTRSRLSARPAVVSHLLRGLTFGGAAFLLGSCPLFFDAAPLGIALLCASSAYTWYIAGGLLLSALLRPAGLNSWAWVGVYLFCLILRLVIRFFVDPPVTPDGKPCAGRTYARLCWRSFKRNIGFGPRPSPDRRDIGEDYYEGVRTDLSPDRAAPAGKQDPAAPEPSAPRAAMGDLPEIHLFAEHPFLRMLTAAAGGFVAGLFGMFIGGFRFYHLWAMLLLIAAAPLFAGLFVSCFGETGLLLLFAPDPLADGGTDHAASRRSVPLPSRFHILPLIGVGVLMTAAVYAARAFTISFGSPYLTVELSMLLGLILTLLSSVRMGFVTGIGVSILCGMAVHPLMAPAFILTSAGYALFRVISHRVGILAGCAVGAIWCLTGGEAWTLVRYIPALLLAVPLYFVIEKLWALLPPAARADRKAQADFADTVTEAERTKAERTRLHALSDAFSSLSRRFYRLSDQLKRPRMADLRRACDEAFVRHCTNCPHRDTCWGAEYDRTLETETRLTAQLHTRGQADTAHLPASLCSFCPQLEKIVTDMNARCAHLTEALLKSEKTEVFAADYEAIADILEDALKEDSDEYRCNRAAADAVFDELTGAGAEVEGVVVCGRRSCRVIVRGRRFDRLKERKDSIHKHLERICDTRLSDPVFEEEDGHTVMTLASEPALDTVYTGSTLPAHSPARDSADYPKPLTDRTPPGGYEPPAACGDHIALFKTDQAYFYALISDGMGTGEDASVTSDICALFMEKMLRAGNRVEISLRMLNGLIRSKNAGTGDECSATMDLMELDLFNGHAVFAKSGAVPTYVVRDGTVYKLRSRTMPIGILKDSDPEYLRFRMHPGDVVVMVSDGVTLGNDECPWLIDLLSHPLPKDIDDLRTDIIRRALSSGSPDDLSAIAIRIVDNA